MLLLLFRRGLARNACILCTERMESILNYETDAIKQLQNILDRSDYDIYRLLPACKMQEGTSTLVARKYRRYPCTPGRLYSRNKQ